MINKITWQKDQKKKRKTTKKKKRQKKLKVEESQKELIIKTKSDWIKNGIVNKKNMKKNIMIQLRTMKHFGKKKVKELHG